MLEKQGRLFVFSSSCHALFTAMITVMQLFLFCKVTRTKSRWKCTLKDGIMHINNKDILFNKVGYIIVLKIV